jgi:pilus assembly protein Flp/PilA
MVTVTGTSRGRLRAWVKLARAFKDDTRGATAIEYALIASGISVAIVTAVTSLGGTTKGLFSSVQTAVK